MGENGAVIHSRVVAADIAPEIGTTRECHGTWVFARSQLVITLSPWCADGEFVVTWRGGPTLVRERQGHHWVYRKVGR